MLFYAVRIVANAQQTQCSVSKVHGCQPFEQPFFSSRSARRHEYRAIVDSTIYLVLTFLCRKHVGHVTSRPLVFRSDGREAKRHFHVLFFRACCLKGVPDESATAEVMHKVQPSHVSNPGTTSATSASLHSNTRVRVDQNKNLVAERSMSSLISCRPQHIIYT